jgi:hypothetical protein
MSLGAIVNQIVRKRLKEYNQMHDADVVSMANLIARDVVKVLRPTPEHELFGVNEGLNGRMPTKL